MAYFIVLTSEKRPPAKNFSMPSETRRTTMAYTVS